MQHPTALDGTSRRLGAALACGLSLSGCDPAGDDALDAPELEPRTQIRAMDGNFELAQDDSRASHATASVDINVRNPDGSQQVHEGYDVRGTCGATFISPHFAITAAHCVDEEIIGDTTWVTVQTYDITGGDPWWLMHLGVLDGFYPDYVPRESPDHGEGYEVQGFECEIASRCAYGSEIACAVSGLDVAMLHCPGRDDAAAWLPVAPDDPGEGPVEMYWFHEVLDMPTGPLEWGASSEDEDRFEHYTSYSGAPLGNNYHYLRAKASLMPLKSVPWPDGTERRRVGDNWTDLYGCHGTSGSGVLQRNEDGELELLGPVREGSPTWQSSLLCTDPNEFHEGMENVSYVSNSSVREFLYPFDDMLFGDRRASELEQ